MHITRHLTITGCAVVVAALGAGGATAVAQTATHTPSKLTTSAPQARADCDIISPTSGDHAWLDGFSIGSLPAGLGPQVSDFEYEWEDVSFTSRVWETGPDDDGAYRVDLHIAVLRGEVLTDAEAMHAFLAEYHERDPAVWARDQFRHADGSGFRTASEAFWLAKPGVAVQVYLDRERFSEATLVRIARGVRAARNCSV
jgi:hypothetical protein